MSINLVNNQIVDADLVLVQKPQNQADFYFKDTLIPKLQLAPELAGRVSTYPISKLNDADSKAFLTAIAAHSINSKTFIRTLGEKAIEGGNEELFLALLDRHDGNLPDLEAFLCAACKHGHLPSVDILLTKLKGKQLQGLGRFALHQACSGGHLAIVNALIAAKFPLENRAGNFKPIDIACGTQNFAIAKRLIQAGADWKEIYDKREIPLLINLLKEGVPVLHQAVIHQDPVMIEELMKAGADINTPNPEGQNCLFAACLLPGYDAMVIWLLLNGAHPCQEDSKAMTPHLLCLAQCNSYVPYFPAADETDRLMALKVAGHLNSLDGPKYESFCAEIFHALTATALKADRSNSVDIAPKHKEKLIAALEAASKPIDIKATAALIRAGELVIIPTGWKRHAIDLVFCNGYFWDCNRGEGVVIPFGTVEPFKIDLTLRADIFEGVLKDITENRSSRSEEQGVALFYHQIPARLSFLGVAESDTLCDMLKKELAPIGQKIGNCSAAATKAAVRVALAMLEHCDSKRAATDPTSARASKKKSKRLSVFQRLMHMEYMLKRFPNLTTTIDKSWQKIKKQLKKNPISVAPFKRVKAKFWDPENTTLAKLGRGLKALLPSTPATV